MKILVFRTELAQNLELLASQLIVPPVETDYHAPFLSVIATIAMDSDLFQQMLMIRYDVTSLLMGPRSRSSLVVQLIEFRLTDNHLDCGLFFR
jgi:hypothetical protein